MNFATLLGAVPLAIAAGPGAELRGGIAIIGGLLVSQVLSLYTTLMIYVLLDKLHHRLFVRSGGRAAHQHNDLILLNKNRRRAPLTRRQEGRNSRLADGRSVERGMSALFFAGKRA
jgi:hypothetical protein